MDLEMERSKRRDEYSKREKEKIVGRESANTKNGTKKPVGEPCDVCPRLVVRVCTSASSLYRGNQIARHKFCLYAVMHVKVTTAKLAESKKRRYSVCPTCVSAWFYLLIGFITKWPQKPSSIINCPIKIKLKSLMLSSLINSIRIIDDNIIYFIYIKSTFVLKMWERPW